MSSSSGITGDIINHQGLWQGYEINIALNGIYGALRWYINHAGIQGFLNGYLVALLQAKKNPAINGA